MPIIRLHINGLTHHDIAEQREEFLQTAVGRRVVLRPACLCEDACTVEAYVGGKCVGVVSRLDADLALAALRGVADGMLRGRIVEAREYQLVVEAEVESLLPLEVQASGLAEWKYGGPLLAERADERKLAFLESELTFLLEDAADALGEEDVAEALELLEEFFATAVYDISIEGLTMRRRLLTWLEAARDERLRAGAGRLHEMSQRMGGDHWMQHLGRWMKSELPTSREAMNLFVKPAVLPEVMAAAERLPNDLFTFWRTDTAQFARVLYGMQPSRKELRSVLSCLVVIELLGGGADDDEEKVDHFVRRLVDETKNLYKHERDKIEVVRQILYNVGRNDAEAELDAWIEGREYKPTVNVDIKIDKGNDEVPLTVADKEIKEAKVVDEMEELIEELAPMFFNDRDEARTFVRCIQGKKAHQITDTVNMWVRDKRISDLSRFRPLWQTLHDHNLYNKSESNWNKRVR